MKKAKKFLSLMLILALAVTGLVPVTAFAATADAPRVMVESERWARNLNLTEVGETDWIYVGRVGDMDTPTLADRKAGEDGEAVDILQFSYLKDTHTWNSFLGTGGTSISWSDGVNSATCGGTSGYRDMLLGFYGSETTGKNWPAGTEVGWVLNVPAADEVQVVTFLTGASWASVRVKVYANGDTDTPLYNSQDIYTEEGNGEFRKYVVTVGAGTSLEIRGEMGITGIGPDMITLAGAGLSRIAKDPGTDYVTALKDAVDVANAYLSEDLDSGLRTALTDELAIAGPIAEKDGLTDTEAYSAYQFLKLVLEVAEATPVKGSYANTTEPAVSTFVGWEGDKNAPILWADGSYQLRSRKDAVMHFGVTDIAAADVDWSRAEGYLPCYISAFSKNGLDHTVKTFADEVTVDGKRYEAVYTRMITENTTDDIKLLPIVSADLQPLNRAAATAKVAKGGETVTRDYVAFADQFGGAYPLPENGLLADQGDWDSHYANMAGHWEDILGDVVDIVSISGYDEVTEAYKAAVIDALIASDGAELHPSEGGSAYEVLDGEAAAQMLTALVKLGCTENFGTYAAAILKGADDATAPMVPQMFAAYLQKTWDYNTVMSWFNDQGKVAGIKSNAHKLGDGTAAINGLITYAYLCDQLSNELGDQSCADEAEWARGELMDKTADAISSVAQLTPGKEPWSGYLFSGDLDDDVAASLDSAYGSIAQQLNLGSQTGYSTSGNAGAFLAGLLSDSYRGSIIPAYQWMIENTMTTPYGWWKDAANPATSGTGALPHVPGALQNAQALADALIAERVDGVLILGRGIPAAIKGVEIADYLCNGGQRVGYTMTATADSVTVTLTGDRPEYPVSVELPILVDNIAAVSGGCTADSETGTVTMPAGVTTVTIALGQAAEEPTAVDQTIEAIAAIGTVTKHSGKAIKDARALYDDLTDLEKALVTNYDVLVAAEKTYEAALSTPVSSGGGGSRQPSGGGSGATSMTQTTTGSDGNQVTTTTNSQTGTVTETTTRGDNTTVVTVTAADGTVTKTATDPQGGKVESVTVPGESYAVTVTDASGKTVAKVNLPVELPAAGKFSDIGPDHWAKKSVDTVSALGLFQGTADGSFAGNDNMTRGMIVTVLYRLSGNVDAGATSFGDVAQDAWYAKAVAWAGENGIVKGVDGQRYAPDQDISRETLATILYRFAGVLDLDTAGSGSLKGFSDQDAVSGWSADAMGWAVANGLINGRGGALAPTDTATRVEVATVLTRFIGLLGK